MADKYRRTFPIPVTFVDGELPPAPKLNALGSQTRNGLALIEKAVGDIFNQSGDQHLSPPGNLFANALFVNSLGRSLGAQNLISPRIPDVSDIATYRDVISHTGSGADSQEGFLRYKPNRPSGDQTDFTIIDDGSGAIVAGQYKKLDGTTGEQLDTAGDWHVTENGRLLTFSDFTSVTLEYDPIVQPDIDSEAAFNVIPDPNTSGAPSTQYFGIKVAYANDSDNTLGYWIYLPPRRPLSRELAKSPNETENERSGTYFFQDPTADAQNTTHHRYKFTPLVVDIITDAVTSGFSKQIPDNYLYLYDKNTGTVIDGLTFEADSSVGSGNTWIARVKGAKLDQLVEEGTITVSSKSDESSSAYENDLYLVQPGTTAAQIMAAVLGQLKDHNHNNADGTVPVSHSDLKNLFDNNSPAWGPSNLNGDDHPQYLHRDGYDGTSSLGLRDAYRGGMRGSLLLLNTNSASNYFNTTGDSRRIHFGDDTNSLWYESSENSLSLLGIPSLYVKDANAALRLEDFKVGSQSGSDEIFVSRNGSQSGARLVTGRITVTDRSDEGTVSASDNRLELESLSNRLRVRAEGSVGDKRLILHADDGTFIANDDRLYFPQGGSETNTSVFLNRTRVDGLAKLVSAYSTPALERRAWNHGGDPGAATSSTSFVELSSTRVAVPDPGVDYILVVNAWTTFSTDTDPNQSGLRMRIAVDGFASSFDAVQVTSGGNTTDGDTDTLNISTTIGTSFGLSGSNDVFVEVAKISGASGGVYFDNGEIIVQMIPRL